MSGESQLGGSRGGEIGPRFVAADGMLGIEIVDRPPGIGGDHAIVSADALWPGREKEDVSTDWFHQHAVMNDVLILGGVRQGVLAGKIGPRHDHRKQSR